MKIAWGTWFKHMGTWHSVWAHKKRSSVSGTSILRNGKFAYSFVADEIIGSPLWLNSRAVSFPMPVLAPVMTTTLLSKRTVLRHREPWNQRGILRNNWDKTELNTGPGLALYRLPNDSRFRFVLPSYVTVRSLWGRFFLFCFDFFSSKLCQLLFIGL